MINNTQPQNDLDLKVYLGTRNLLTGLWQSNAPSNSITWYPAHSKVLTLDDVAQPLTPQVVERAILNTPEDTIPCLLLSAGGLVLNQNTKRLNQLVHEATSYNPWEAVVQITDKEYEVTPVSFAPLGRRAALKVAGSIIETICPLCPFEEVCTRTPKPHTGNMYSATLNYHPGILVDI